MRLSNQFYFVTPKNLVTVQEVPVETGLMEVHEDGTVHIKILAPFRNTIPLTNNFVASICRRMDKPRLSVYNKILNEDGELESYSKIALDVIRDNITYWQKYKIGSKEIPDKIAAAMEALYYDIEEAVRNARQL